MQQIKTAVYSTAVKIIPINGWTYLGTYRGLISEIQERAMVYNKTETFFNNQTMH